MRKMFYLLIYFLLPITPQGYGQQERRTRTEGLLINFDNMTLSLGKLFSSVSRTARKATDPREDSTCASGYSHPSQY